MKAWVSLWGIVAAGLVLPVAARASERSGALTLPELFTIIQSHQPEIKTSQLAQAALQGIAKQFPGAIEVAGGAKNPGSSSSEADVSQVKRYGEHFLYLRIRRVSEGLSHEIQTAYQTIQSNKPVQGLILDVRFAGGEDYAAAGKVADLFLSRSRPLLMAGDQTIRSVEKTNALTLPVVTLVNGTTRGAAEALAGALRESKIGLLIGDRTAGMASVYKTYRVKGVSGAVQVAVAPVKLGDGTALPSGGIQPDIVVQVSSHAQEVYYKNPYAKIPNETLAGLEGTNAFVALSQQMGRHQLNEAELVRLHREGKSLEDIETSVKEPSPPQPKVIRDPVLARAIDLLKALVVVRSFHPA